MGWLKCVDWPDALKGCNVPTAVQKLVLMLSYVTSYSQFAVIADDNNEERQRTV